MIYYFVMERVVYGSNGITVFLNTDESSLYHTNSMLSDENWRFSVLLMVVAWLRDIMAMLLMAICFVLVRLCCTPTIDYIIYHNIVVANKPRKVPYTWWKTIVPSYVSRRVLRQKIMSVQPEWSNQARPCRALQKKNHTKIYTPPYETISGRIDSDRVALWIKKSHHICLPTPSSRSPPVPHPPSVAKEFQFAISLLPYQREDNFRVTFPWLIYQFGNPPPSSAPERQPRVHITVMSIILPTIAVITTTATTLPMPPVVLTLRTLAMIQT